MEKLIILLLLVGCAPFEPIPGLCYTDKTGTYLCMEEEVKDLTETSCRKLLANPNTEKYEYKIMEND